MVKHTQTIRGLVCLTILLRLVKEIFEKYKNHFSFSIIRSCIYIEEKFKIQLPTFTKINNIIENTNLRKSARLEKILA